MVAQYLFGRATVIVRASDAECFPGLVGELRAGISMIPIPKTVWSRGDRVKAVIVISPVETRQQCFALVDGWIELPIPVYVCVDDQLRRLRDDDLIAENGNSQRRHELGILHED